MTWEEKLKNEIFPKHKGGRSFSTDKIGQEDIYILSLIRDVESNIQAGLVESVKEQIQDLVKAELYMKKLWRMLKSNPNIQNKEVSGDCFTFREGRFSLGYGFTYKNFPVKILQVSRLIRDGEKRCMKHPRHKRV